MVGVCADPVIAQVMITFFAISCSLKLLYVSWAMWPDALSIEPSPVRRSSKCQIASPLSWTRVTEGTGLTRATDAIQTAWASSINAFTASAGSSLSTITCVSNRSQEARSEEHTSELQSL